MKRGIAVIVVALGMLSVASRISFSLSPRGVTNDFTQDYISGRAWTDHLDPYGDTGPLVDHYFGPSSPYHDIVRYGQGGTPHPPSLILLVRPIASLPYGAARVVWLLLMASATAFALGWFARSIGTSRATAFVIGIGSLAIPVVQTDLIYGQSTGLLLLLLVEAWVWMRDGHDRMAGAALGIATALKLFPLFMIIALVRSRRAVAARWLLGSAILVGGVSAAVLGIGHSIDFIRTVSPQNVRFWRAAPMNISLLSVPYRWLTKSVWRPGATNVPALATVLALGLLVSLIVAAYRSRSSLTGDVFWETAPFMLLAIPTVWETYLVLAIPLTFLFIRRVAVGEMKGRWVVYIALALISIGLFPGLPPALETSNLAQLLGYSLPMYGLLIVAFASLTMHGETGTHLT